MKTKLLNKGLNPSDREEQIELIFSVFKKRGVINREILCSELGIKPLAAGALMRSFVGHLPYSVKWQSGAKGYVIDTTSRLSMASFDRQISLLPTK